MRKVSGTEALPGTLVVDRYKAYDKAPCALQYCYAHLLRTLQDPEKGFPGQEEIKNFVSTIAALLAEAMHLHSLPIPDALHYIRAEQIKSQIIEVVHCPAHHLYPWATNRLSPDVKCFGRPPSPPSQASKECTSPPPW